MRIALLSPYSWTYPGGVTRHIDALASELRACEHDVRVLAPYDPDDELSRRLHRGARPQPLEVDENFVSLGRTAGIPANGAVSNMCLFAQGLFRMRDELRHGGYDVLHIHEPVVPVLSWDALCSLGTLPLVGHLPHLLGEPPDQRRGRSRARRPPADEPTARAHRGLGGRRLDGTALLRRALRGDPQRRAHPAHGRLPGARAEGSHCGSCSSERPSNGRACRCCWAPSKRCASRSRRRSRSSAPARPTSPT